MRTNDEILARIKQLEGDDYLGFETTDLIFRLPFEQARPYLKEGTPSDQWEPVTQSPEELIVDYLPFAWDKANDQRGISASRSVSHMRSWLWLGGHDEAAEALSDLYECYGKPCLVMVSEMFGFDWKKEDDGGWTDFRVSDSRDEAIEKAQGLARKFKATA
jgi:hypothetical protein